MILNSNRGRGINAYIAPVISYTGEIDTSRAVYPKPKPGQENDANRSKFFQGEVDESNLADGWWYWKEAVFRSTRSAAGLVKIQAGGIVAELGTIDEMKILICDEYFPNLPPLIGSSKQVDYGNSKRAKYLLQLWALGLTNGGDCPSAQCLAKSPDEAKWWIEADSCTRIRDWLAAAIMSLAEN